MKSYLFAGFLILAGVATFFALVAYLGGYGAMISACIIAGLMNETTERTTNPNE
jgi:hypothetical protein